MRKLNKKNKAYVGILSTFAIILFAIIIIFIVYKFKDMNIKYSIADSSFTFNLDHELIKTGKNNYVKKDFVSRYFLYLENEKINLGSNAVIYNENSHDLQLFGTFYEILPDGEINKIKGESDISTIEKNRIFKIADRKYLVVGPNIKSTNGVLSTKGFLLIDLDKVGNGLLYNHELNIKTFNDLFINNENFDFKINEELLTINDEVIDLAKINGSSNEYIEKKKTTDEENGNGEGAGGNGSGNAGENIFPEPQKEEPKKPDSIIDEKYISRKTSVLNSTSTANSITVNYIVYDPFTEYTGLYVVLYGINNNKIGTYELNMNETSYTIESLDASTDYKLYFYYSYVENEQPVNTLFDTLDVSTKSINAKIALEMMSENSVRYIIRVDGKYELDSATVTLNVINGDDISVYTHKLGKNDLKKATSDDGLTDVFEGIDLTGEFVKLTLKDCVYNGKKIDTEANYKVKM